MVALTRMISAVFRRGGEVAFVAEELKQVFDPRGGQWMNGRYVPSLLAAIGEVIERHMIETGFLAAADASVLVAGTCAGDRAEARQPAGAALSQVQPARSGEGGGLLELHALRLVEMQLNASRLPARTEGLEAAPVDEGGLRTVPDCVYPDLVRVSSSADAEPAHHWVEVIVGRKRLPDRTQIIRVQMVVRRPAEFRAAVGGRRDLGA